MIGHLAVGDGEARRPGVLVCHEGPGLTDHARDRADRLAGLGFAAFALDYHGDGKPLERDEMMPRLGELMGDPDRILELARAGLDILLAQSEVDSTRLAAIGYCFGGTMALELARGGTDLSAVVGFHSGLATGRPAKAGAVKAAVLVCIGADDPMVPAEQRAAFEEEMRAAEVDWRMNLYGGAVHSFTNPSAGVMGMPGVAYHQPTDERSWRAMLDFFEERFGPA
jgi:dienelactone hydrolase